MVAIVDTIREIIRKTERQIEIRQAVLCQLVSILAMVEEDNSLSAADKPVFPETPQEPKPPEDTGRAVNDKPPETTEMVGDPALAEEQKAIEFFERERWGDAPECPHCQSREVVKVMDRTGRQRSPRFLWRCHKCHRQFTVQIGTIMECSRIRLSVWYKALRLIQQAKGSHVNAMQFSRECGVSYGPVLAMLGRIKTVLDSPDSKGSLFVKKPAEKKEPSHPHNPIKIIPHPGDTFRAWAQTKTGKKYAVDGQTLKCSRVIKKPCSSHKGQLHIQIETEVGLDLCWGDWEFEISMRADPKSIIESKKFKR
jgi:transposase-like protein